MKQARDLAIKERNLAKEPRTIKHWEAVIDTLNIVVKIVASTHNLMDILESVQNYAEKALKTFGKHLRTAETEDMLVLFRTAETYLQIIKRLTEMHVETINMDLKQAEDARLKQQNNKEQL